MHSNQVHQKHRELVILRFTGEVCMEEASGLPLSDFQTNVTMVSLFNHSSISTHRSIPYAVHFATHRPIYRRKLTNLANSDAINRLNFSKDVFAHPTSLMCLSQAHHTICPSWLVSFQDHLPWFAHIILFNNKATLSKDNCWLYRSLCIYCFTGNLLISLMNKCEDECIQS